MSPNSIINLNIKPQRVKVGDKYNKLTVIKKDEEYKGRQTKFICKCDCGKILSVFAFCLLNANTRSCGCLVIVAITKHSGCKTPEYQVWSQMKDRCLNVKSKRYKSYGGRGIKVCERWMNFENFIEDMGLRPSENHSVERNNNNGDYEKSNCYWATDEVQRNNKQNTRYYEFNGVRKSQAQWARYFNLNHPSSIAKIISRGKTFNEVYKYYENKKLTRVR